MMRGPRAPAIERLATSSSRGCTSWSAAAIERAIELCGGNVPRAASLLEAGPSTLYRKRGSWGRDRG